MALPVLKEALEEASRPIQFPEIAAPGERADVLKTVKVFEDYVSRRRASAIVARKKIQADFEQLLSLGGPFREFALKELVSIREALQKLIEAHRLEMAQRAAMCDELVNEARSSEDAKFLRKTNKRMLAADHLVLQVRIDLYNLIGALMAHGGDNVGSGTIALKARIKTPDTLPSSELAERFERLLKVAALPDGWHDGEGTGPRVRPFDNARTFLMTKGAMAGAILIYPTVDGGISFEMKSDRWDISAEFLVDGSVELSGIEIGGESEIEPVRFSGVSPDFLKRIDGYLA